MFRFAFELIGLLIFFTVVRIALTWIVRFVAGAFRSPAAPQPGVLQTAGELQKDPVCGTFVPVASSLKRIVSGHPVYFCSPECRDRY